MKRDEDALVRMIRDAGSPEAAGRGLLERLEALETAVAELERRSGGGEPATAPEAAPDGDAAVGDRDQAEQR